MIHKSWRAAKVSLSVSHSVRSSKTITTYKREIVKAGTHAAPRIVDMDLKRHPWRAQHDALLDTEVVETDSSDQ